MSEELEQRLKAYRPFKDKQEAEKLLSEWCQGKRHSMRVPPDVNDFDMVLSRILQEINRLESIKAPQEIEGLGDALGSASISMAASGHGESDPVIRLTWCYKSHAEAILEAAKRYHAMTKGKKDE